MQQLGMLLNQAIGMMGQGAVLKQDGKKAYADAMLAQSADLLRRAMSGPEMAAMHKGGQGQSVMMQHTHALGAAAFDLLDMMMSMPMGQASNGDEILHHALTMAAQGANMKSLAVMGMSKDIAVTMQDYGLKMQQASMHLSKEISISSDYQKAALKVIDLLTGNGELNKNHMH